MTETDPSSLELELSEHPLLDLYAFTSSYPEPLGEAASPEWLCRTLSPDGPAPLQPSDELRRAVRDLLRQAGFKPTGRNKPACEYLIRAASEGGMRSINPAVDACNAVSLHSGLPISVVDLDRTRVPLSVSVAAAASSYVFNPAGQVIELAGLLCLFDAEGPCANAVKDAQRTKTGPETRNTLSLIWGTRSLPGRAQAAVDWYREVVERTGATTRAVSPTRTHS